MPNSTVPAAATGLPADRPSFKEQREERERKAQDHFRQLYSNWLSARGEDTNPAQDNDDDDADSLRGDWVDEAARLLFITPAALPYMVWQKIEVFEFYLCGDGACEWTDERQVAFFGCIKADLARLRIGKDD
jgi:FMN phosphatase YigB (HAD superfamily)